MNVTKVLNGSHGHQTTSFAKTVLLNQIAFDFGRAATRIKPDNPVADARDNTMHEDILATFGLDKPKELDTDNLLDGFAAAFVLVARFAKTTDPETDRPMNYVTRYLKTPDQIITEQIGYQANRQAMETKATAMMLGANAEERLKVIAKEQGERLKAVSGQYMTKFKESLELYRDADDSDLIDVCLDAMTNAGRNPAKEMKAAAKAILENAKKRFEAGQFVRVDAGIYALAADKPTVEPLTKEDKDSIEGQFEVVESGGEAPILLASPAVA